MARRHLGVAAAVAVAVSATACGNESPSAPQDGPAFAKAPSPYACLFTGNPSLSNAANSYFTTTDERRVANDHIDAMAAGFADGGSFAGARDAGFDLLAFTGTVSRGTTAGDTGDGGALVRQAIQCMFDVEDENDQASEAFFGWPTDKQFDFGRALSSATAGAFFVRGGPIEQDPQTDPVVANDESVSPTASGNISGIAPPAGNNWPAIVATGILPDRVLIYGEPVTGGYDWKLIPRSTAFIPSATVALCPAATTGSGTTADMISQETVGVLGYVSADFICQVDPDDFASAGPSGAFAIFARLSRSVGRWFEPSPLQAAVRTSTIGGSASGAKGDQFTEKNLPTVRLSFNSPGQQPPANPKVNTRFSLSVNVKTLEGDPAGGITVALTATTNNGTNTGIFQIVEEPPAGQALVCDPNVSDYLAAPSATTLGVVAPGGESQPTNAVWNNNLCFSKTGAVYVNASSTADGRTGGIGSAKSNKVNVRP